MTLHKLKVAALQHEQREEWGAAIELYRQAHPGRRERVRRVATPPSTTGSATWRTSRATTRLPARPGSRRSSGTATSASSTPPLRSAARSFASIPQRLHTYLELARLQARKRVLYDVRRNLQTYLERMTVTGHADVARARG